MSRADIHPKMNKVTFKCSCGATFATISTLVPDESGVVPLEVCSNCHPFYTGKQKLVDTAGRVDRFERMYGKRGGAKANTASTGGGA